MIAPIGDPNQTTNPSGLQSITTPYPNLSGITGETEVQRQESAKNLGPQINAQYMANFWANVANMALKDNNTAEYWKAVGNMKNYQGRAGAIEKGGVTPQEIYTRREELLEEFKNITTPTMEKITDEEIKKINETLTTLERDIPDPETYDVTKRAYLTDTGELKDTYGVEKMRGLVGDIETLTSSDELLPETQKQIEALRAETRRRGEEITPINQQQLAQLKQQLSSRGAGSSGAFERGAIRLAEQGLINKNQLNAASIAEEMQLMSKDAAAKTMLKYEYAPELLNKVEQIQGSQLELIATAQQWEDAGRRDWARISYAIAASKAANKFSALQFNKEAANLENIERFKHDLDAIALDLGFSKEDGDFYSNQLFAKLYGKDVAQMIMGWLKTGEGGEEIRNKIGELGNQGVFEPLPT